MRGCKAVIGATGVRLSYQQVGSPRAAKTADVGWTAGCTSALRTNGTSNETRHFRHFGQEAKINIIIGPISDLHRVEAFKPLKGKMFLVGLSLKPQRCYTEGAIQ